jgi:hypothetical protein
MHSWYLGGLDHRPFQHLFEKSDSALAALGIQRRWAGANGGHPCRMFRGEIYQGGLRDI